ncbi:MAG: hypothetical protein JWO92_1741 [Chitinophagaceae bacterium]|nr:hypothetical protein [Chitinophagaceae bacterium]MDB5222160.1 hypothetical protein [Chitinophagaceae bacterium]
MENKTAEDKNRGSSEARPRHDADSGNDSSNEMLQHEKLIDPGNEHSHHSGIEKDTANENSKFDADAGGDGTGTMGSKPE